MSYEAVDSELPALLAREKPDALVMFGLAGRSRHLRVETRARNSFARMLARRRRTFPRHARPSILRAPPALSLRAPAQRLLMAARATGVPAELSRDAGRYLCNYLCWRAVRLGCRLGAPRLVAFVHVPGVPRTQGPQQRRSKLTLDDLVRAGEAIVRATVVATRHADR